MLISPERYNAISNEFISSVPSSIASKRTARTNAVWWKLVQNPKIWFNKHNNHGIITLNHSVWNEKLRYNSSVFSKWAFLSSNYQTASLSSGSLARCNPVTLISSPTLSYIISKEALRVIIQFLRPIALSALQRCEGWVGVIARFIKSSELSEIMERGVETSFQPVRQIWGNPQVLPRHHLSCHIYLFVRFEMKMVGGETQPIDWIARHCWKLTGVDDSCQELILAELVWY